MVLGWGKGRSAEIDKIADYLAEISAVTNATPEWILNDCPRWLGDALRDIYEKRLEFQASLAGARLRK